eukprot:gnl/Carplike_NY0171/1680_a2268_428.p1 GENE.gnl/Carplike_NY0171/1680_a2268_428~~gnl/Carplike_NY0171/1680_a2268_428.p1  ORF type:complete len:2674 (-),score=685.92 gnl/Carplike_NY0171/1680_a2268_428:63-8084(-)
MEPGSTLYSRVEEIFQAIFNEDKPIDVYVQEVEKLAENPAVDVLTPVIFYLLRSIWERWVFNPRLCDFVRKVVGKLLSDGERYFREYLHKICQLFERIFDKKVMTSDLFDSLYRYLEVDRLIPVLTAITQSKRHELANYTVQCLLTISKTAVEDPKGFRMLSDTSKNCMSWYLSQAASSQHTDPEKRDVCLNLQIRMRQLMSQPVRPPGSHPASSSTPVHLVQRPMSGPTHPAPTGSVPSQTPGARQPTLADTLSMCGPAVTFDENIFLAIILRHFYSSMPQENEIAYALCVLAQKPSPDHILTLQQVCSHFSVTTPSLSAQQQQQQVRVQKHLQDLQRFKKTSSPTPLSQDHMQPILRGLNTWNVDVVGHVLNKVITGNPFDWNKVFFSYRAGVRIPQIHWHEFLNVFLRVFYIASGGSVPFPLLSILRPWQNYDSQITLVTAFIDLYLARSNPHLNPQEQSLLTGHQVIIPLLEVLDRTQIQCKHVVDILQRSKGTLDPEKEHMCQLLSSVEMSYVLVVLAAKETMVLGEAKSLELLGLTKNHDGTLSNVGSSITSPASTVTSLDGSTAHKLFRRFCENVPDAVLASVGQTHSHIQTMEVQSFDMTMAMLHVCCVVLAKCLSFFLSRTSPSLITQLTPLSRTHPMFLVDSLVCTYNIAPNSIGRLLDVAYDLRLIPMILGLKGERNMMFVNDVVALSSQRKHVNLTMWLNMSILNVGAPFVKSVLDYLRAKIQKNSKVSEAEITPQTAASFFSVLAAHLRWCRDPSYESVLEEVKNAIPSVNSYALMNHNTLLEQNQELKARVASELTVHHLFLLVVNESTPMPPMIPPPTPSDEGPSDFCMVSIAKRLDTFVSTLHTLGRSTNLDDRNTCRMVVLKLLNFCARGKLESISKYSVVFGRLVGEFINDSATFLPDIIFGLAVSLVLNALKSRSTTYRSFGLSALEVFTHRLAAWVAFANQVLKCEVPTHAYILSIVRGTETSEPIKLRQQEVIDCIEPDAKKLVVPFAPPKEELETVDTTAKAPATQIIPTVTPPGVQAVPHEPVVPAGPISVPQVPAQFEPTEHIKKRVNGYFNRVTPATACKTGAKLGKELNAVEYQWFASVLVERCCTSSHSQAFVELLRGIDKPDLLPLVLGETLMDLRRNLQKVANTSSASMKESLRDYLQKLGAWLGYLTIAEKRPLFSADLDIPSVFMNCVCYETVAQFLSFLRGLLSSCRDNPFLLPTSSWCMGILGMLKGVMDMDMSAYSEQVKMLKAQRKSKQEGEKEGEGGSAGTVKHLFGATLEECRLLLEAKEQVNFFLPGLVMDNLRGEHFCKDLKVEDIQIIDDISIKLLQFVRRHVTKVRSQKNRKLSQDTAIKAPPGIIPPPAAAASSQGQTQVISSGTSDGSSQPSGDDVGVTDVSGTNAPASPAADRVYTLPSSIPLIVPHSLLTALSISRAKLTAKQLLAGVIHAMPFSNAQGQLSPMQAPLITSSIPEKVVSEFLALNPELSRALFHTCHVSAKKLMSNFAAKIENTAQQTAARLVQVDFVHDGSGDTLFNCSVSVQRAITKQLGKATLLSPLKRDVWQKILPLLSCPTDVPQDLIFPCILSAVGRVAVTISDAISKDMAVKTSQNLSPHVDRMRSSRIAWAKSVQSKGDALPLFSDSEVSRFLSSVSFPKGFKESSLPPTGPVSAAVKKQYYFFDGTRMEHTSNRRKLELDDDIMLKIIPGLHVGGVREDVPAIASGIMSIVEQKALLSKMQECCGGSIEDMLPQSATIASKDTQEDVKPRYTLVPSVLPNFLDSLFQFLARAVDYTCLSSLSASTLTLSSLPPSHRVPFCIRQIRRALLAPLTVKNGDSGRRRTSEDERERIVLDVVKATLSAIIDIVTGKTVSTQSEAPSSPSSIPILSPLHHCKTAPVLFHLSVLCGIICVCGDVCYDRVSVCCVEELSSSASLLSTVSSYSLMAHCVCECVEGGIICGRGLEKISASVLLTHDSDSLDGSAKDSDAEDTNRDIGIGIFVSEVLRKCVLSQHILVSDVRSLVDHAGDASIQGEASIGGINNVMNRLSLLTSVLSLLPSPSPVLSNLLECSPKSIGTVSVFDGVPGLVRGRVKVRDVWERHENVRAVKEGGKQRVPVSIIGVGNALKDEQVAIPFGSTGEKGSVEQQMKVHPSIVPLLHALSQQSESDLIKECTVFLEGWKSVYEVIKGDVELLKSCVIPFIRHAYALGYLVTPKTTDTFLHHCFRFMIEQDEKMSKNEEEMKGVLSMVDSMAVFIVLSLNFVVEQNCISFVERQKLLKGVFDVMVSVLMKSTANSVCRVVYRLVKGLYEHIVALEPAEAVPRFLDVICDGLALMSPTHMIHFIKAWFVLVTDSSFVSLLMEKDRTQSILSNFLVDFFAAVYPFLADSKLPGDLYEACCRFIRALTIDYPGFIVKYKTFFLVEIPHQASFLKSLIAATGPNNMRVDDFDPLRSPDKQQFVVDRLPEIHIMPPMRFDYPTILDRAGLRESVTGAMKLGVQEGTAIRKHFASLLLQKIKDAKDERYGRHLLYSATLFLTQFSVQVSEGLVQSETAGLLTIGEILQKADSETCYQFITFLVDNLSYPNRMSYHTALIILWLFAEKNLDAFNERLLRALLERYTSGHKPWAVTVCLYEMVNNKRMFRVIDMPCYKNHPELRQILDRLKRENR